MSGSENDISDIFSEDQNKQEEGEQQLFVEEDKNQDEQEVNENILDDFQQENYPNQGNNEGEQDDLDDEVQENDQNYDNYDNTEQMEDASTRKRKRRSKKDANEPKKEKKIKTIIDPNDPEELQRQKKKNDQKSKKEQEKEKKEKINVICEKLVQKDLKIMNDAYEKDRLANKNQQPAINKLKYVDRITEDLKKAQVADGFLQNFGLDYIMYWLKKLPDGSEPSSTLKKKMLNIIDNLNVTEKDIQGTKLGKIIFNYRKPNEPQEIRILANKIVDKWTRIITRTEIIYNNYEREEEDDNKRFVTLNK